MHHARSLEELPNDWREQLSGLPTGLDPVDPTALIERLEGRAQIDTFLFARDFAAVARLLVAKHDEVNALKAQIADLKARRVERIQSLLRDTTGTVVGSITESVKE